MPPVYATVVPGSRLYVPQAGRAAAPTLYVLEFFIFNTLEVPGVIVKAPSLNTLLEVTSPMVRVVMLAAAPSVTPVVLLIFSTLYVSPAIVWAEVPLQFTVPDDTVMVPVVLVRFPPMFRVPLPISRTLDAAWFPI